MGQKQPGRKVFSHIDQEVARTKYLSIWAEGSGYFQPFSEVYWKNLEKQMLHGLSGQHQDVIFVILVASRPLQLHPFLVNFRGVHWILSHKMATRMVLHI